MAGGAAGVGEVAGRARRRPVESVDVRRHNLSRLLGLIDGNGPRSRAQLALETGLTRSTVSSLVAELIALGLLAEIGLDADQGLGRPGTLLELDGSHIVTIGAEIHVGHVAILARDIGRRPVYSRSVSFGAPPNTDMREVIDLVGCEIVAAIDAIESTERSVLGVTVAIPGVVNMDRGTVVVAPNLGWNDVPLLAKLRPLVDPKVRVALDNEANLGALAEFQEGEFSGTKNMAYIVAESGVGAGLIVNGLLMRGVSGAAGEVGHMTVKPRGGLRCACGNTGCWETLIGVPALLRATLPDVAAELIGDVALDTEAKVRLVLAAAERDDPGVRLALDELGYWAGVGIANLLDVFDPEVVVLAGHFRTLAPWILPATRRSALGHAMAGSFDRCRIEVSSLGFSAGGLGGTIHAAERLFADPSSAREKVRQNNNLAV